jgi:phosphate starvation-inducible membrane PsiE
MMEKNNDVACLKKFENLTFFFMYYEFQKKWLLSFDASMHCALAQ